ncbi:MAG: hypothetical protein IPN04_04085 [Rhodoferax sp.]|nr:hypothetical protein [Rhodoferax sp.]
MRTFSNIFTLCKSLVVVTLTMLLVACGGGNGEPEVVKPKKPAVIMVLAIPHRKAMVLNYLANIMKTSLPEKCMLTCCATN